MARDQIFQANQRDDGTCGSLFFRDRTTCEPVIQGIFPCPAFRCGACPRYSTSIVGLGHAETMRDVRANRWIPGSQAVWPRTSHPSFEPPVTLPAPSSLLTETTQPTNKDAAGA